MIVWMTSYFKIFIFVCQKTIYGKSLHFYTFLIGWTRISYLLLFKKCTVLVVGTHWLNTQLRLPWMLLFFHWGSSLTYASKYFNINSWICLIKAQKSILNILFLSILFIYWHWTPAGAAITKHTRSMRWSVYYWTLILSANLHASLTHSSLEIGMILVMMAIFSSRKLRELFWQILFLR